MRRKLFIIMIAALLMVMLPGTMASFAQGGNQANPIPIFLRSYTFTPVQLPDIPTNLSINHFQPGENAYYIVQFDGPIQEEWKAKLESRGVDILEYLPDYAFKVRMNPRLVNAVMRTPGVNWVGIYQPAYKISPDISRSEQNLLTVRTQKGIPAANVVAAIRATGATVVSYDGEVLRVLASNEQIDALARIADVSWIETFKMYEKHNEYGGGVILGGNTANANGYNGSTQIVAVADTGLGGGTPDTAHPDLPASRIADIFDWPTPNGPGCFHALPDGSQDVDSGHGTHTSISIVGDGGPNGEGKGMAPAATLVMQTVEDYVEMVAACASKYHDGYYLLGLPDDIRDLFSQAYNAGARIHSDSWGASVAGEYTTDAANTDDFMWSHPDMLVSFSAGNSGIDANGDGVIDEDSIGSPATAKNVLSVGASENDRADGYPCDTGLDYGSCADNGGVNTIFTYGQAWPDDYPADPIASDPIAGNSEQMAAFSSRGPTDDGRIKPDVVAPGTYVLSGYSDMFQQSYDAAPNPVNGEWQYDGWGYPMNQNYKYMGGTSMSNPLTAGAAVLVRDYYQKMFNHNASAALTKATLINSAVDMLDENNDGVNDNAFPIPNIHEGWGRVNVADATDGTAKFVDEATGIMTGQSRSYVANVSSDGAPLKVTLVWTDFPGSPAASKALVNDLDLIVTSPSGDVYKGNVFSNGWSVTDGDADRLNNVENVFVQAASTGDWTIEIMGYNAPEGPQPFALVVEGASDLGVASSPANSMHVSDLDGTSQWVGYGFKWTADVTITVMDGSGAAVANATVDGTWSGGFEGSATCVTGASGMCTVTTDKIRSRDTAVSFAVDNISHDSLTYKSDDNNDPDGDSDGSMITVNRPPTQ